MTRVLRIGISPCPNDTHVMGAWSLGLCALPGVQPEFELTDIETLNQAALAGTLDIAKVSCALLPALAKRYILLETGAAIVRGFGPLLVAREALARAQFAHCRIAVPGEHTTGTALLKHYAPNAAQLVHYRFNDIIPAITAGEVDAGVVINESRLAYAQLGLLCVADLGAWWTWHTGLPVALGCYVMRQALYPEWGARAEQVMRESLAIGARGEPAVAAFVMAHAQEMSAPLIDEYIALYVNASTHELGTQGRVAISALNAELARGTAS